MHPARYTYLLYPSAHVPTAYLVHRMGLTLQGSESFFLLGPKVSCSPGLVGCPHDSTPHILTHNRLRWRRGKLSLFFFFLLRKSYNSSIILFLSPPPFLARKKKKKLMCDRERETEKLNLNPAKAACKSNLQPNPFRSKRTKFTQSRVCS